MTTGRARRRIAPDDGSRHDVGLDAGLDLAHAFAATGDTACLAAWEDLVERYCESGQVDHEPSAACAERVLGWIDVWRQFVGAPSFSGLRPGLTEQLCSRIVLDANRLGATLPSVADRPTLDLYALLVAALAIPQIDPSGALAERALAELGRHLLREVGPDGVHRSRSTDHHHTALRSFLGAAAAAMSFGMALPEGFRDRLEQGCDVALHLQRPHDTTPSLSDVAAGDVCELLTLAGDVLDRPDLTWAGTRGRRGVAPGRLDATFAAGGYVTQRSGWGSAGTAYADERQLVLDCGPHDDGGHARDDRLGVQMAAAGGPIIVDPGSDIDDAARRRRRRRDPGPAARNTVTVDQLELATYRRAEGQDPLPAARLVDRCSCPRST